MREVNFKLRSSAARRREFTMATCILCGAEGAQQSRVIYGIPLSPLCPDCSDRCYNNPNDVVTTHAHLFRGGPGAQGSTVSDISVRTSFCSNCGFKISEGAAFCEECGTKVTE